MNDGAKKPWPTNQLEQFSTGALVRELERRSDGLPNLRPIKRWCEDCTHFRHSTSERDTRNNCTREHAMDFRVPDGHNYPNPEAWGFYRRGCSDWTRRPEPDQVRPIPGVSVLPPSPPPPRGSRPRRTK